MANFFKKIISGLDFWDKDENARQRQQFAKEDKEEKRRRAAEKVRSYTAPPKTAPLFDNAITPDYDPKNPLKKVGSQSQFNTETKNPFIPPAESTPAKTPKDLNTEKKIDQLAVKNYDSARKKAEQGESWLSRNVTNRKAVEERARTIARGTAARQYKEKNNWAENPSVSSYQEDTKRIGNLENKRLGAQRESLADFQKKLTKAGEVASYVPVTGSVINVGLASAEKLAKANGNNDYGADIANQRLQIDLGMNQEKFDKLDSETQRKLRNLQNLGLAMAPLDFIGTGGVAKSGVVAAGRKGFQEAVEGGVKASVKNAIKKAGIKAAEEAAIPLLVGTGASAAAQGYLGGAENINPLDALKTGALTAGSSLLFPSQGIKEAGEDAVDNATSQAVKNSVDEVDGIAKTVEDGVNDLEQVAKTPSKDETSREVVTSAGESAVEVEKGIKSTNIPKTIQQTPKIPDVTNPIALAKSDPVNGPAIGAAIGAADDIPIANFNKAVPGDQPLVKAPTIPQQQVAALDTAPQKAEVAPSPEVDVNGNPILKSDAQRAQELAAEGIVPERGDSITATSEADIQAAAEQAAREQAPNPASLRERQAFASTEADPVLAQEILDTVPGKTPLNVEESLSVARINARSKSPEQLVSSWSEGRVLDQNDPQTWINALEERKVLNAMVSENVPGAREARLNLADAMSNFQSKSGQNFGVLKVAYGELPSDMKAELLVKKINRERNRVGMDDLPDQEMELLLGKVESADSAEKRVKAIENEVADFNRSATAGFATPEARSRLEMLNKTKEEALVDLYTKNAEVTDYFSQASPDSTFGQKVANWNRTSMLSSLSGRIFDLGSTGSTTALDTANRALSALFARVLNDRVGKGGALETLPQALPSLEDLKNAGKSTFEAAQGKNQVRDIMAEIKGMATGRSELENKATGGFRNLVKAGTELPTEATKYIENNEIYRYGRQRAKELNLEGDDAKLFADSYWAVASSNEKYAAQQEHLKANMLHNNIVSSKIDAISNTLIKSNTPAGKTTGAILKSIVAPFTRFIGGMTHRTFTDMNVVHNMWEITKAVKNGDTQLLSNSLAKLTTNTAIGFSTATVLANSGILTPTDANGDSYGGLYFHVGDRYIPVSSVGLASVPMVVGYGINQAMGADNPSDVFTSAVTDTLDRVIKSSGTGGFFGGDNVLQTALGGAMGAINPSDTGSNENNWAEVVGSSIRQSIPAIGNDINAVLNLPKLGFNPTGEAAETKVLKKDGTKDPIASQLAKTQNTIPGLSQLLERRKGTPARDFLDRITKGNHETDKMAKDRVVEEGLKASKKVLDKEGIPTTSEKIQDLVESGEYGKAIRGSQYRLDELEADPDTPKSRIDAQRRKLQRYEVFNELDASPKMVTAYERSSAQDGGIGVTAWRDMIKSGDQKLVDYAERLYNLDKALVDSGAVFKSKYYWTKGSGRSSRGGGRGRRSGGRKRSGGGRGGKSKFSTNIATQDSKSFTYSPIKAQGASYSQPQTAIPKLKKVANNDTSMLKKISVKRGGRA